MLKATTIIILIFTTGAAIAHALHQPVHNEAARIEAEIEAYRNSSVIGWWEMDEMGQLYFKEKP